MRALRAAAALALLASLAPRAALANCSSPPGTAGDLVYSSNYNVMQFCNGSLWMNMGSSNGSGIGTLVSGDYCTSNGTVINCNNSLPLSAANGGLGANESSATGVVQFSGGTVSVGTSLANGTLATTQSESDTSAEVATDAFVAGIQTLSSLTSAASLATVGTITTGTWHGTAIGTSYITGLLPVADGGTGDATVASNGVLYGNGTGAVQATAQGGANTILTANSGAPAWSATPEIGTSLGIGYSAPGSGLLVSGNVGIGSTSPGSALTVTGNGDFYGGDPHSNVNNTSTGHFATFELNGSDQLLVGYNQASTVLRDGGLNVMTLLSSGNVGIGTTAPESKFDIWGGNLTLSNNQNVAFRTAAGTPSQVLTVDTSNNTNLDSNNNTLFYVGGNGTLGMEIASGGNVGIGTTAPSVPLVVAGQVNVGSNSGSSAIGLGVGAYGNRINTINGQQNLVLNSNGGALYLNNDVSDNVLLAPGGGNVGIGMTGPSYRLDVAGASGNPGTVLRLGNAADSNYMLLGGPGSGSQYISAYEGNFEIYNSYSGGTLQLGAGNNPAPVTINTSGNVGIGTTSPVEPLHVRLSAGNDMGFFTSTYPTVGAFNDNFSAWGNLQLNNSMFLLSNGNVGIGTTGPNTTLQVNGGIGINGGSISGRAFSFNGANSLQGLAISANGTTWYIDNRGNSDTPNNRLDFSTGGSDLLTILSTGSVGIGTPSPSAKLEVYTSSGSAIYGYAADNATALLADNSGGGWGVLCNSGLCGGNAAWSNLSDIRLKERIAALPDERGLAAIDRLRPITFHWKDKKKDARVGQQIGFIAQEIEPLYPEMVTTDPNTGMKNLSYAELTVPLVKAVQELKADNDKLRRRDDELEREVADLKREIHAQ